MFIVLVIHIWQKHSGEFGRIAQSYSIGLKRLAVFGNDPRIG